MDMQEWLRQQPNMPMNQMPMNQIPMNQMPMLHMPMLQMQTHPMQWQQMQLQQMQLQQMQLHQMQLQHMQTSMPVMQFPGILPLHPSSAAGPIALTYERVTVSVPRAQDHKGNGRIQEVLEEDCAKSSLAEQEEDCAKSSLSELEEDCAKSSLAEVEEDCAKSSLAEQEEYCAKSSLAEEGATASVTLLKTSKHCSKAKKKNIRVSKRKPHNSAASAGQVAKKPKTLDCSPRKTRQSSGKSSDAGACVNLETSIRDELEKVPAHMRASSKFHEEHLRKEAQLILDIVETDACSDHLQQVVSGQIARDSSMMMEGGQGPFTLFQDLRVRLLDLLEEFKVGPNMKYGVLLPEAIIFALRRIHRCSWEEGLKIFSEESAIVEPFQE